MSHEEKRRRKQKKIEGQREKDRPGKGLRKEETGDSGTYKGWGKNDKMRGGILDAK